MSNQNLYILRIDGGLIDRGSTSCTGKQMGELLAHIDPWVRNCDWYILDIKTNNSVDVVPSCGQAQRLSRKALGDVCARVDQFLSGIFLAVPSDLSQPRLHLEAETEDEPSSDIGDALVELRAFDTSYFEIYTPSLGLAENLQNLFGVAFESNA